MIEQHFSSIPPTGYPPPPMIGQQYPPRLPPPPTTRVVTKTGLTPTANIIHLCLTMVTCGLWAPFWALHWVIASRKQVTTTKGLPPR